MSRRRALVRLAFPVATAVAAFVLPIHPAAAEPAPLTPVHDAADPAVRLASDALAALREGRAVHYSFLRRELAQTLAPRLEVDAEALDRVWRSADPRRMTVVLAALEQLGAPYRYATSDPAVGFDCSGLTGYAWRQVGIDLPNQSRSQIRSLADVDPVTARPGDVLWYPGHVMISLGLPGSIVHAVNRGNPLQVATLSEGRIGRLRAGDPLAAAPVEAPVGNFTVVTIIANPA